MVEPSAKTLEYARQIIKYSEDEPKNINIFGHSFIYATEEQARLAHDALVVKFAMFLEQFWLDNQIVSWDAAAAIKGQA